MLSTQGSAGMVVLTASDGSARLLAIWPHPHLGPAPQNTSVRSETAAEKRSVPHVLLRSPLNARNTLHVSPQSKDQRFLCCTRAVETFRSYCSCAGHRAEGKSSSSVTQRRICALQWSCHAFISGYSRFRTVLLISLGFSCIGDSSSGLLTVNRWPMKEETCFELEGKLLNSHF